jgi:hypothetical protein
MFLRQRPLCCVVSAVSGIDSALTGIEGHCFAQGA